MTETNQSNPEGKNSEGDKEKSDYEAKAKETLMKGVFIGDVSETVHNIARDRAETEINERQNKRGVSAFFDKIYLRILEEGEKWRLIKIYKEQINSETGLNLHAGLKKEGDKESSKEELEAITTRFLDQEAEQLLHVGEERKEVHEDAFTKEIKTLLTQYTKGEIDDKEFEARRREVVDTISRDNRDIFLRNEAKTDNLFEIAKQLKDAHEHGASLEKLDEEFKVTIGRARGGLRTEAKFNAVDRIVDFMQTTPVLNCVTSETVGVVLGYLYSVGAYGAQRIARSKVALYSTYGAAGAFGLAYGIARKNKELKTDLAMHYRQMASGREIKEGSKRREQMEQFRVENKSAKEVTSRINEILESDNLHEQIGTLLEIIADTRAKIRIADIENIDLIAYSDITKVEKERTDLDIALAKASNLIEKHFPDGAEQTFQENIRARQGAIYEAIRKEMSEKSEAFQKYKLKENLWAGAKGAAAGVIAGAAMHEVVGWASHLRGDEGVGKIVLTPGQRLLMYLRGERPRMNPEILHVVKTGEGSSITLPKGVDLIRSKDGSYSLFNSIDKEKIADHIHIGKNGAFTGDTIDRLKGLGINASDTPQKIVEESSRAVTLSDKEMVEGKFGITDQFHRVFRNLWFDNNTKMYMGADGRLHGADLNEIKLMFGGVGNTGLDQNGNFVMDVSHMTRGGSFHKEFNTDFLEDLQQGRLKLNMSLSRETQRYVTSILFNKDGQAVIPRDSKLAKIFFENVGGRAVFKGRFAEVAEVIGQRDGSDVVRMLATYEGRGLSSITTDITEKIIKEGHKIALDIPRGYEVAPPPVIPIFGRKPLETLKEPEPPKSPEPEPTPTPEPKPPEPIPAPEPIKLEEKKELKYWEPREKHVVIPDEVYVEIEKVYAAFEKGELTERKAKNQLKKIAKANSQNKILTDAVSGITSKGEKFAYNLTRIGKKESPSTLVKRAVYGINKKGERVRITRAKGIFQYIFEKESEYKAGKEKKPEKKRIEIKKKPEKIDKKKRKKVEKVLPIEDVLKSAGIDIGISLPFGEKAEPRTVTAIHTDTGKLEVDPPFRNWNRDKTGQYDDPLVDIESILGRKSYRRNPVVKAYLESLEKERADKNKK